MTNFTTLSKDLNKGTFTYETLNKFFQIEVLVDFNTCEITVFYYKGKMLTPTKKEKFHSLYGCFGKQSLEEKFNEIIKNL
jgi:hypothetical protein